MEEKKKHAGGRPSKIDKIDLTQVEHLATKGYTDKKLADIFCVTEQTINNWKIKYPEFFESLKKGKMIADAKVEASLYQRACGYSHPDVHISNYQGIVKRTPIIKHYPPDPASMCFWLKNRDRENWRDHSISIDNSKHTHITTIVQQVRQVLENDESTKTNSSRIDGSLQPLSP